MKKSTRVTKAKETLEIIDNGYYEINDTRINTKESILDSVKESRLYTPGQFDEVLGNVNEKVKTLSNATEIEVLNITVLKAASDMHERGLEIGCLNFASAKNPGGGFLGGAIAQEESLALSSALYATQMANFGMYEHNRAQKTLLYSDYMIYSPRVPFFRNDDGELLEQPYTMNVITSPAVNVGAIKVNRPYELESVRKTMLVRLDKVLALFVQHNVQHLLLGAWGCGVFQNRAEDVAGYFKHYLGVGGKYEKAFKTIVFAVLDRNEDGKNITAFKEAFGNEKEN
jgi:uncharacterized protein (TIGR02452 family)